MPFPPGGSTDLVGRAIAKAVEQPLKQSVPVANKPGANGAVGGKEVLASAPDGYNIGLLVQSLFAITPLAVKDETAIQLDRLTIVATLTTEDYVLVVNANSPHKTLEDLLKAPKVSYGTTGVGTGAQLSQALLFKSAGANAVDVPFDGGAPAVTAVLGEQVDAISAAPSEIMQHVKAGKLRPLATFSTKRSAYLPDVPTAQEKGHDVVVDQRRFVVAPQGLPDNVRKKLADAFAEARKDAGYDKFLKDAYAERWEVSGDEARQHMKDAGARYAAKVQELGISLGKK
ncbi:ABC transporter substrate-binding protein [Lentzea sp. NBRC 105346]|uniref:tripartite tricarboxylate transporter substrate binding protein n=1 Tax=Lentzea sp. NBRC 105346 TaxID=3032205 RepID=UPI0024A260B2|nr:tripartite tricarboxylate transporter substrate binding protein [Lentzea sp. NBRC 105346]GLZ34722.1 ABC transporter substrate-binding protein [Lentzea sp. NBRC 105346]